MNALKKKTDGTQIVGKNEWVMVVRNKQKNINKNTSTG
jgi:hypothetical protein